MRRRCFLQGIVVVPITAMVRPDALTVRKAAFEEVGNSVLVTLTLPTLFRRHDKEALASIDSGFDTTLEFTLKVWERGSNRLMGTRKHVVKIRRDPWKKRYVVSTRSETGWSRRYFEKRDDAIAAAVKLDRIRVISASLLERGEDGPYYFVTVLALRNPLDGGSTRGPTASGRSRGRDLEWFGRLVDVIAGERPQAEEIVQFKTNLFYLVPR